MSTQNKQIFDFSLDALAFREQLAKRLQQEKAAYVVPLEDDDLEYLHAAGMPHRAPEENEPF